MSLSHHTRVKICGITSQRDAAFAVAAGAHALGFIFYADSARYISIEQAVRVAATVPPLVSLVGVFVDAKADWITAVLDAVPLSALQFHGAETEADCLRWSKPYIKAVRVKKRNSVAIAAQQHPMASALLLDTFVDDKKGGTGQPFDWSLLAPVDRPIILAGGLRADNVVAAIKQVRPYAVDVSSGVESEPGIKSEALLQAFMQQVRQ